MKQSRTCWVIVEYQLCSMRWSKRVSEGVCACGTSGYVHRTCTARHPRLAGCMPIARAPAKQHQWGQKRVPALHKLDPARVQPLGGSGVAQPRRCAVQPGAVLCTQPGKLSRGDALLGVRKRTSRKRIPCEAAPPFAGGTHTSRRSAGNQWGRCMHGDATLHACPPDSAADAQPPPPAWEAPLLLLVAAL